MKKSKPLLYDPLIINRVKQYLEENVDKTYLDVGVMTKQLQDRYPEYTRRKVAPFRALVEQAYRIVSHSYGMESQPSSGDDSGGSDLEVMDDASSNNLMSNMMNSLYQKTKPSSSAVKQPNANEAIDISSDESGDEGPTNGKSNMKNADGTRNFSGVSLTKIPNPEDSTAKGMPQPVGPQQPDGVVVPQQKKKRTESNDGPQHNVKKPKVDEHAERGRIPEQYAQFTNYNQNSNDGRNSHSGASGHVQRQQSSKPRKYKKEVELRKSRSSFQDVGGMEKTLKELLELLIHIRAPDIYFVLGLMPPRGVLLHGPPGCGKTLLARAVAGQLNMPLIEIPATELIAGVSGESEERIRDIFEQAMAFAPCVLFIDEIDAISSNRSTAQKDMERRIVSQLISSMDNLKNCEDGQSVLVIGATTRPDVLDPALRRVGRFDHEVSIGIPSRKDRKDILSIICEGLSVEGNCDFDKIAELTPGFVGADLLALVSRAATIAVKRKCADQMRLIQANAQRNITIVDLDDDADESVVNEKSKDEAPAQSADKTNGNKEQPANATENTQSTAPTAEGQEQSKANEVNGAVTEKATTTPAVVESMEVDSDPSKTLNNVTTTSITGENDAAEHPSAEAGKGAVVEGESDAAEKETSSVNLPEPSLLELLNLLEYPLEDMAYISDFCITFNDFRDAVKVVQPSAKREGFITVPDVTWDDVGSLQDIREELKLAVLAPVKFPEKLQRLGLSAPSGVLLCGPPGCGKTLLAKAIANEAGINFISVKGPELMNKYVGESERAVRACFQRARNSAPCVIFFDEFDSLCPKRTDSNENSSGTRVVNQLLTEMDGVEERKGVYILAASNRPDIIDPAILRPGRLDTVLYVGLPQTQDRVEILKATTKNRTRPVLADDVDFDALAHETEGYTGADLAGLVRQAAMLALKESLNNPESKSDDLISVHKKHFDQAIRLTRPSVNAQDKKIYEKLRLKYAAPRADDADE